MKALGWHSELDSRIPDGFSTFTRANMSEVVPEVVTPLVHSVLFPTGERGFQRSAIEFGAWTGPVTTDPPYFQGCFYGRIVLNVSTLMHCAARLPGQDPEALGENYLGETREIGSAPVRRDHPLRRMARLPRVVAVLATVNRRARRASERVDRFLDDQGSLESASAAELAASLARTQRLTEDTLVVHLHASGLAGASFGALGRGVARWTGADDPGLTASLVTGLDTLDSARPTHALWAWSRGVVADPDQASLVANHDGRALLARLRDRNGDRATARVGAALDTFLADYGARGRDAGSSWQEDPAPVLDLLRAYLDLPEARSPTRTAARQRAVQRRTVATLRARLSTAQRVQLWSLLSRAARTIALREQLKGDVVRLTAHLRAHGLECGRRLAAAGILDAADDTVYLGVDELAALACAPDVDVTEVRERVRRRRDEYERNLGVELPETFAGRPDPVARVEHEAGVGEGDVLRGIAVSPGCVTATARVILDAGVDDMIEPGEILVAPITDTGWTPLFSFAVGLVVDLGGLLSHGSIVAREFGLPAVVNVKDGTRRIRTGDRITVDGDAGVVTIHRQPA